jgi:hypothetical protein
MGYNALRGGMEMSREDIGFWVGIIGLVLAVPLGVAANLLTSLLTPRLVSYLEKRRLIKAGKTRRQALLVYNRIRAFQEGRRDRYVFYILLASSSVLLAIASSTLVIVIVLISPQFENAVVFLVMAFVLAFGAVILLASIYETARQLDRFDDYKREFEERWGPPSADDLKP